MRIDAKNRVMLALIGLVLLAGRADAAADLPELDFAGVALKLHQDVFALLSPGLVAMLAILISVLLAIPAILHRRRAAKLRDELDGMAARIAALEQTDHHRPLRRVDSGPLAPDTVLNLIPPGRYREQAQHTGESQPNGLQQSNNGVHSVGP